MKKNIMLSKFHRAVDDEFYNNDLTYYNSFKEIIKLFGKKKCKLIGERLFVFNENSILMYERREGKFPLYAYKVKEKK
jgi:hypothetical protein